MTGRSEIDELQALAESISAEAKGWRAHRRRKTLEHRDRQFEVVSQAPRRRRWRHRLVAIGVVLVIAIGFGTWGIVAHQENKVPKAVPPKPVTSVPGYSLPYVKAGRLAAETLAGQGRSPNQFDCEAYYESNELGATSGQAASLWHDGFMHSCLSTQTNAGGTD
jgi:hypothetical protein